MTRLNALKHETNFLCNKNCGMKTKSQRFMLSLMKINVRKCDGRFDQVKNMPCVKFWHRSIKRYQKPLHKLSNSSYYCQQKLSIKSLSPQGEITSQDYFLCCSMNSGNNLLFDVIIIISPIPYKGMERIQGSLKVNI